MIRIYPAPEHEHAVIDVLDSLKGPITTNSDCLVCAITVETDGTGAVCYLEKWRTSEALKKHMRSALFGRILAAMEFSRLPPEVAFYSVTETVGLEMVALARSMDETSGFLYNNHKEEN